MTGTPHQLSQLKQLVRNPRKHGRRNIEAIASSLRECGAGRSILIDEEGTVLCGNGTLEAATEAGIQDVTLVESDGTRLVAVIRRGLTDEQKCRLVALDNRVGELAEWDPEILAGFIEADPLLEGFWTVEELSVLVEETQSWEPVAFDNLNEEELVKQVAYTTCPQCGHEFPK